MSSLAIQRDGKVLVRGWLKIPGIADPRSVYSQALKDPIDAAGNEAILNVFAANAPSLTVDLDPVPRYPVQFDSPSMLVVGASSPSDTLAWFSSYGRTGIDLASPGLDIVSNFRTATQ